MRFELNATMPIQYVSVADITVWLAKNGIWIYDSGDVENWNDSEEPTRFLVSSCNGV